MAPRSRPQERLPRALHPGEPRPPSRIAWRERCAVLGSGLRHSVPRPGEVADLEVGDLRPAPQPVRDLASIRLARGGLPLGDETPKPATVESPATLERVGSEHLMDKGIQRQPNGTLPRIGRDLATVVESGWRHDSAERSEENRGHPRLRAMPRDRLDAGRRLSELRPVGNHACGAKPYAT